MLLRADLRCERQRAAICGDRSMAYFYIRRKFPQRTAHIIALGHLSPTSLCIFAKQLLLTVVALPYISDGRWHDKSGTGILPSRKD